MSIKYETNAIIEIQSAPLSGAESIAVIYRVRNSYLEIKQGRTNGIRLDKKQLRELQIHLDKICDDLEQ